MITASHIAAYRQDHGTQWQHVAIERCPVTISYGTDPDTGNALLNLGQLKEFFAHPSVNIGQREQGEVQNYLESVAEGND